MEKKFYPPVAPQWTGEQLAGTLKEDDEYFPQLLSAAVSKCTWACPSSARTDSRPDKFASLAIQGFQAYDNAKLQGWKLDQLAIRVSCWISGRRASGVARTARSKSQTCIGQLEEFLLRRAEHCDGVSMQSMAPWAALAFAGGRFILLAVTLMMLKWQSKVAIDVMCLRPPSITVHGWFAHMTYQCLSV